MKDFQLVMLVGIIIMLFGGLGIMLSLYFSGKLEKEINSQMMSAKKAIGRLLSIKKIQVICAIIFLSGFLIMTIAAGMR